MIEDEATRRNKRLNELNALGLTRFGEGWGHSMAALGRAIPGGIPPQAMDQVLANADPGAVLMNAGTEHLLHEADLRFDKTATAEQRQQAIESENAYNKLRQEQREAHKRGKGR